MDEFEDKVSELLQDLFVIYAARVEHPNRDSLALLLATEGGMPEPGQVSSDERLFMQVYEKLSDQVERKDLEALPDSWEEFAATLSYLGIPIRPNVRDEAEAIIEELKALSFRRVVSAENSGHSTSSLTLVDPLLLDIIAKHPELLKTLDWRSFEKLLAQILENLEYEIELQRGTKNGGVDIFALKRYDPMGPHRYLLQAKRWSHAVGVEPVREVLFLHSHYRMTKSCLATTSRFTSGAWEYAREYRWQLELRDFDRLMEWLNLAQKSPKHGRTHNKGVPTDDWRRR